jgi:hypothetical protein
MTLETRNHQFTSDGAIDCEVNHPDFGWIPFTAKADDPHGFAPEVWAAVKDRTDIAPAPPPPGPTKADVDAEAVRRVASGFVFNGTHFQSDALAQKRITGAAALAHQAITVNGKAPTDTKWHGGSTDFAWIATDNSLIVMDAQTVLAFGAAAANWESVHVFAAKALKDTAPIPADYADDKHWP